MLLLSGMQIDLGQIFWQKLTKMIAIWSPFMSIISERWCHFLIFVFANTKIIAWHKVTTDDASVRNVCWAKFVSSLEVLSLHLMLCMFIFYIQEYTRLHWERIGMADMIITSLIIRVTAGKQIWILSYIDEQSDRLTSAVQCNMFFMDVVRESFQLMITFKQSATCVSCILNIKYFDASFRSFIFILYRARSISIHIRISSPEQY